MIKVKTDGHLFMATLAARSENRLDRPIGLINAYQWHTFSSFN